MSFLNEVKAYLELHKTDLINDLKQLLRIPSISTDPLYKNDVLKAHDWIKDYLQLMNFEIESVNTSGYPVIIAKKGNNPKLPHVLIYNHYDVQPVDPVELWTHPPFEPFIDENEELYARGAQDNKGQFWAVICALKALLHVTDSLPCNITLCIEGEEESGSRGINGVLESLREKLQADLLLVVDVDIPALSKPAVTLGARGVLSLSLELTGSKSDLHSGLHGGIVYNPNHALVKILSSLRDDQGRVLVEGFYDDVVMPNENERQRIDLSFDEDLYEQKFQAKPCGGEVAFSPLESCWLRPTLEINGIQGGYGGDGFKTVIPAKAKAKISCRLVANQDPEKILKSLKERINSLVPKGITSHIEVHSLLGWARSKPGSVYAPLIQQAYEQVLSFPCKSVFSGGSIPITSALASISKADLVFIGCGLSDDNIHAPNEHYGLQRLFNLACILVRSLELIAEQKMVQNDKSCK
jgi:acetylornithine deacetylase/succinyl-diaminopimelate desuccinylase-like protein